MAHNFEKRQRHIMDMGCPARAFEEAEVTVPILVRADADVREVELKCMGEPRLVCDTDVTPGRPGAVSRFTVSQRLRVDIPIVFKAETEIGEGHVRYKNCGKMEDCHDEDVERDDDCGCKEKREERYDFAGKNRR